MNPGSSQFASQFPDAEETMSKMESKTIANLPGLRVEAVIVPIRECLVFKCDTMKESQRLANKMAKKGEGYDFVRIVFDGGTISEWTPKRGWVKQDIVGMV